MTTTINMRETVEIIEQLTKKGIAKREKQKRILKNNVHMLERAQHNFLSEIKKAKEEGKDIEKGEVGLALFYYNCIQGYKNRINEMEVIR